MKKILLLAVAATLFCACNVQVINPDNNSNEEHNWGSGNGHDTVYELRLTSQQEQMLQLTNDFSLNLLSQVYNAETSSENVIISPLSASMALSMLMNAADNQTLEQVKQTLGFADWSDQDINEFNRKLIHALPYLDTYTQLTLANSLWLSYDFPVNDDFVNTNNLYYYSKVSKVYFTDPATATLINQWAADNTQNLINNIVSPETIQDCAMVLANALYFKGVWADKFEKELTQDRDFTTSNNVRQVVDMMHKEDNMKYQYLPDKQAQLLELDYLGDAYCMDILLPSESQTISSLLSSLSAEEMSTWEDKFWPEYEYYGYDYEKDEEVLLKERRTQRVKVQMPKFALRYSRTLNDDLISLGMTDMFNPFAADFSRLSTVPTFVSFVKQDTYMSVDEAGTEAAAVTVIGFTEASAEPHEYKIPEMYINRPFVLFIRDRKFGTILFAAVIGNPKKE